jgi:sialic acid synthase SpsE
MLRVDDLDAKRPASGLSPMELDSLVGRRLRRTVHRDEDLIVEDID